MPRPTRSKLVLLATAIGVGAATTVKPNDYNVTCSTVQEVYHESGCCAPDTQDKRIYELPDARVCAPMTMPDLPGCDENCYMAALLSRGSALTPVPDFDQYVDVRTVDAETENPFPFPPNETAYLYIGGGRDKNVYPNDLFVDTSISLGSVASGTPIEMPLTFSIEAGAGDIEACATAGYDIWDVASVAISYDAGETYELVEDPTVPYNGYCAYAIFKHAPNVPYTDRRGWSNSVGWTTFSVSTTQASDDVRLRISLVSDAQVAGKGIAIGKIHAGDNLVYSPGDGQVATGTRELTWSVEPLRLGEWVHMYFSRYFSRSHFVRDLDSPFANSNRIFLPGTPRFASNCSYKDFVNSYDSPITQSQALISEAMRDRYLYMSNDEFRSPLGGANGCYKGTSNVEPISTTSPTPDVSTPYRLDRYGYYTRKMIHPKLFHRVELVLDVIPNSMADLDGWTVGDIIVGCHGEKLYDPVLKGLSSGYQCITDDRKFFNYTLGTVDVDGSIVPTGYRLEAIQHKTDPRFTFNSWEDTIKYSVHQNSDGENVAYVSFHSWYAIADWNLMKFHATNMFDYFRAHNATKHLVIDQRLTAGGYYIDFLSRMSLFLPQVQTKTMADLGFSLWPFSFQDDPNAFATALPSFTFPLLAGVDSIEFDSIDILQSRDDCSASEYFSSMARKASKRFQDIANVRILGEASAGCLHSTGPERTYKLSDDETLVCKVDSYSHNFGHENILKYGGIEPDVPYDMGLGDVSSFENFPGFGTPATDPLLAIAVDILDVPPPPPPPFLEPYNPCADAGFNGFGCNVFLFYYPTFCTDGGNFAPIAAACPTTCNAAGCGENAAGRRLSTASKKVKFVYDTENPRSNDAFDSVMRKTLQKTLKQ